MLQGVEREVGISRVPKFKAVESRPHRPGGHARAILRRRRYEMAAIQAELDLKDYFGEPSQSFFPKEDVVFNSVKEEPEGRKADVAKKRAVIINEILENPVSFPITTNNLSFIERHFPRIMRFSRTLRNKGKLHPGIEKIILKEE